MLGPLHWLSTGEYLCRAEALSRCLRKFRFQVCFTFNNKFNNGFAPQLLYVMQAPNAKAEDAFVSRLIIGRDSIT